MIKKIRKKIIFIFGMFIAFLFKNIGFAAQLEVPAHPLYGVETPLDSDYGVWEKILSIILSPIFLIITGVVVLVIGTIIYIKHRKRNVKKDY